MVASIISGAASRGKKRLLDRAGEREHALERTARAAKMKFRSHGPRWLDEAQVGDDQVACTYVFEFRPGPKP